MLYQLTPLPAISVLPAAIASRSHLFNAYEKAMQQYWEESSLYCIDKEGAQKVAAAMDEVKERTASLSPKELQDLGILRERVESFLNSSMRCIDTFDKEAITKEKYYVKNRIPTGIVYLKDKLLLTFTHEDIVDSNVLEKIMAHEAAHYLYNDRTTVSKHLLSALLPFSALATSAILMVASSGPDLASGLALTTALSTAYFPAAFKRHKEYRADIFADTIFPERSMMGVMSLTDNFRPDFPALALTLVGALDIILGKTHPLPEIRATLSEHRLGNKKEVLYDGLAQVPRTIAGTFEYMGLKSLGNYVRQYDYARDVRPQEK